MKSVWKSLTQLLGLTLYCATEFKLATGSYWSAMDCYVPFLHHLTPRKLFSEASVKFLSERDSVLSQNYIRWRFCTRKQ